MAGIFNGQNRTITNLFNLALTGLFFSPEIRFAAQWLDTGSASNRNTLESEYLRDMTFGLSEGQVDLSKGFQGRFGHAPRVAALGLNEGKKYAFRKFQVQ